MQGSMSLVSGCHDVSSRISAPVSTDMATNLQLAPRTSSLITALLSEVHVKGRPKSLLPSSMYPTLRLIPPEGGMIYRPVPGGGFVSPTRQWLNAIQAPSGDQTKLHSDSASQVSRRGGSAPIDFT